MNEKGIEDLVARGEVGEAVEASLVLYGASVFGYLVSLTSDEDVASEVFQQFSVDFWRGLEGFEWRSSLKTWAFTLARRAWLRHVRGPSGRRDQRLRTAESERIEARSRTLTATWRKTAARTALAEAVEALDAEDRGLLELRLHQKMDWKEIALMLHEGESVLEGAALTKRAAAVRKRFQRIKDRLRRRLAQPE